MGSNIDLLQVVKRAIICTARMGLDPAGRKLPVCSAGATASGAAAGASGDADAAQDMGCRSQSEFDPTESLGQHRVNHLPF